MTSRSFLDCMDEIMSPLEKAQSAVMSDDAQGLLPLLAKPGETANGKITESTLVNEVVGENLLDFAVHQLAGYCVALLTAPPFKWSPERKNVLGDTAVARAAKHPYLPVMYSIATTSDTADLSSERSLASFLLTPSQFFQSPLTWDDLFVMFPRLFDGTEDLAFHGQGLHLLLELLLANPELAPFLNFTCSAPASPACSQCCPSAVTGVSEAPTSSLVADNQVDVPPERVVAAQPSGPAATADPVEFPGCLARAATNPAVLVSTWWWHRLRLERFEIEEEECGNNTPTPFSSPLLLSEWCRVTIRRSILNAMKGAANTGRVKNYAQILASLTLPPRLHAFLAYRDLWPTCARHRITRLRQARPTRPPPRLAYLDDDRFFHPRLLR